MYMQTIVENDIDNNNLFILSDFHNISNRCTCMVVKNTKYKTYIRTIIKTAKKAQFKKMRFY